MPPREQGKHLVVLGSLDTKGVEVSFLCAELQAHGWPTRVVDIGLRPRAGGGPLASPAVAALSAPAGAPTAGAETKVDAMARAAAAAAPLVARWLAAGEMAGIVAVGGGVGTWIGARVMRDLPFGFPKVMVSTLPFDIREHLGAKDIVVFPTVADVLGLSTPLRAVLHNAAAALAGMAAATAISPASRRAIGTTGLGVTTPAVLAVRRLVEAAGYELVSFHAAGSGGAAFEQWTAEGAFCGVLDLTTSELTSELFHGIASAGPQRLTAAARHGVPQVVVPGGVDFVTRGPVEMLTDEDRHRQYHRHSPMFTHVRVDAAGMRVVAREIAARLDPGHAPAVVAVPLRGFSAEGGAGGALHDADADAAFVAELRACLAPRIHLVEVDAHVNDEAFAARACELLFAMIPPPGACA